MVFPHSSGAVALVRHDFRSRPVTERPICRHHAAVRPYASRAPGDPACRGPEWDRRGRHRPAPRGWTGARRRNPMSLDPAGRAPTAGIVATGSELLAGRVHDANGPWIAERLGELGIEVAHILLVGDRPDDMESALRYLAGAGVDLVVTSGG